MLAICEHMLADPGILMQSMKLFAASHSIPRFREIFEQKGALSDGLAARCVSMFTFMELVPRLETQEQSYISDSFQKF
jgi:hypothetical protein